jgi:hypothetical protein
MKNLHPSVIIKIIAVLEDRRDWERKQSKEHPSDEYQKGRYLGTEQTLEAIYDLLLKEKGVDTPRPSNGDGPPNPGSGTIVVAT